MKTFFQSIKLIAAISYLIILIILSEIFYPSKHIDNDYFFYPEDDF